MLPKNGKAGKFLDEERLLTEYPLIDTVGYLELRYKRRVSMMMNTDDKQNKQLHTRANFRRMIDHVTNGNVDKVSKLCAKGLDPNFHCPESGESPLMLATALPQPAAMIMELVNGGAHLDFRMKDGRTALHRAVERDNYEALKNLLDLGASPNYKDNRGLTALYFSVLYGRNAKLTEILLRDHANFGIADHQGWQEVHQACKHGLVQHLEHLLFYGADINSRNASGNTPLHVCAVNDKESCARVLLFRGADKNALNYANQSPYQVAVIAGNHHMAKIIQNHRPEDVVPYRETPEYNCRRRASIAAMAAFSHTDSESHLDLALGEKPPSPCPSYRSLPPFSSASTISETSTGSSSTCTQISGEDSEDTASASVITEKSVTSDSSGVCTSNSGASESATEHEDSPILPGTTCVCVEDYYPCSPGNLQLTRGDIVDVVGVSDCGLLEGRLRNGLEGLFPASSVQEVKLRKMEVLPPSDQPRVEGRRELNARKINTIPRRWKMYGEARTVILHKGKKGFGFVLRGAQATSPLMERQPSDNWPSLQYLDDVDKGGVADLAGLKKGDFLLEINGQDVSQAPHERAVAIIRQSGDLVAMTVVSVQTHLTTNMSDKSATAQRQCATLPRKLSLKKAPPPPKRDPRTTLSVGRARARSLVAGLAEIEMLDRTINEYDSEGRSTKSSSIESIPNKPGNVVAEGSNKIASIRSRLSSRRISTAELEDIFSRQGEKNLIGHSITMSKSLFSSTKMPKVYGSVAAMKRSKATRSKVCDIAKLHKTFNSTPDLNADIPEVDVVEDMNYYKKCHSQEDIHAWNVKNSRHSWACPPHNYKKLLASSVHENFASYHEVQRSIEDLYNQGINMKKTDISIKVPSQIYAETLPIHQNEKVPVPSRNKCPPPTHRPPPPPKGQVVKVDVSRSLGEYANISVVKKQDLVVMSSFRPGDSAKLYTSPELLMPVAYKTKTETQKFDHSYPQKISVSSTLRSHSLPPKMPVRKLISTLSNTSSETENSGDSGGVYSTSRLRHRQRDSLSSDSGMMSDKGNFKPFKNKAATESINQADISYCHKAVYSKSSEPFIPEPDYDNSDEEGCLLSEILRDNETFIQERVENIVNGSSYSQLESAHTEAKQAIQEARERLRFTQRQQNKTTNFIHESSTSTSNTKQMTKIFNEKQTKDGHTGMILLKSCKFKVENNSKPSELNRETHSVALNALMHSISDQHEDKTKNGSKDLCLIENEQKSHNKEVCLSSTSNLVKENISAFEQKNFHKSATLPSRRNDGIRIALTAAQNSTENNHHQISLPVSTVIRSSKSFPKNFVSEDLENCENSSSGVSSDVEIQNEFAISGLSSANGHVSKEGDIQNLSVKKSETGDNSSRLDLPDKQNLLSQRDKLNREKDSSSTVLVHGVNPNNITICNQETVSCIKKSDSILKQNKNFSSAAKLNKTLENENVSKYQCFVVDETGTKYKSVDCEKTIPDNKMHLRKDEDKKLKVNQNTDENLQLIRLQVDSLGRAAVNEVDVLTELVPPPPEFAAPSSTSSSSSTSSAERFPPTIAPPPEFCDSSAQKALSKGMPYVQNTSYAASDSYEQIHSSNPQVINYSNKDLSFRTLTGAKVSHASKHIDRIYKDSPSTLQMQLKGPQLVHPSVRQLGTPVLPYHISPSSVPLNLVSSSPERSSIGETVIMKSIQKEFRQKPLPQWSCKDVSDWLESLFLSEYKAQFTEAGITGLNLMNINNKDLVGLGVKQVGHRLNIERSIKRYMK
ncbi:uncharacterized protein LOC143246344 isoform X2 [Tachypleus tridentatus]